MRASDLVLVQGISDTRETLGRWRANPRPVLGVWLAGSLAIAVGLLYAVWLIAAASSPDITPIVLPGLGDNATLGTATQVFGRNLLVLALHAMACVAGFIAGSSLPLEAQRYSGWWRRLHDRAGQLAIGFVMCATTFSLVTQAWALGGAASTLSAQLGVSPGILLLGLLPHALPELIALFLPLAAWIIASRNEQWRELLAATFVTVAIALPVLAVSALVEAFVSPDLLLALAGRG